MVELRNPLIQLDRVVLSAKGVSILSNVSLTISRGERVALLGANGAGKSTLLRVIHGLVSPTSGRATLPPTREQALIFQRPVMLRRTALENVAYVLRARGASREAASARARELLERCHLGVAADRAAHLLSGGEQQRLQLGRAWALSPALVLADEPTASLAPASVFEVEAVLAEMTAQDQTLIFATHNRGQAKRLANRILFLSSGQIVEDRSADEFFATPSSKEAIEYLNVERI